MKGQLTHGRGPLTPVRQDIQRAFWRREIPGMSLEMVKVIVLLVLRPCRSMDEDTTLLQGTPGEVGRRQGYTSSDGDVVMLRGPFKCPRRSTCLQMRI